MKKLMLGVLLAAFSLSAQAGIVTYKIESYSVPGYSASYLHTADACKQGALYMCGTKKWSLTGSLTGYLNKNGVLKDITGTLYAGSHVIEVTDGRIGGKYNWNLRTSYKKFLFEDLGMGAGKPNLFDGNSMVLWGQNTRAYNNKSHAYGLDIYATRVPEPSMLALLGLGLISLVVFRRRV